MGPIIAFLPLIAAGIGAATSIIATTTNKPPQAPVAPTQAQDQTNQAAAAQASALAQANALTKRRGMASTVLTSPTGTSGSASVQIPTLGT